MSEWKKKRKEILDKLDKNLGDRVEVAQRKYGDLGGKLASGVAAAGSAAADFLTPEDTTDMATMAIGGAGLKALRKLRKLKSAKPKSITVGGETGQARVDKLVDYGKKNKLGLQQMRQGVENQKRVGKIDDEEYLRKIVPINEALDKLSKGK